MQARAAAPAAAGGGADDDDNELVLRASAEWTPLLTGCSRGHVWVVMQLLGAGAEVDKAGADGRTPLMWAGAGGHVEIARRLLAAGAAVDAADSAGRTPLMWACTHGSGDIVQRLLEAGATPDCESTPRWTALTYACANGRDIAELLVQRISTDLGGVALLKASALGTVSTVGCLLRAYAYDAAATAAALHEACGNGHPETVASLLSAGADANALGALHTPLTFAASRGHLHVVRVLVAGGACVEGANKNGHTALHEAGSAAVAAWLLAHGGRGLLEKGAACDPSPLEAAYNRAAGPDVLACLVRAGACVDDGSLLQRAVRDGRLDDFCALLEGNPAAGQKTKALWAAASRGNEWLARELVHRGADPRAVLRRAVTKRKRLQVVAFVLSVAPDGELVVDDELIRLAQEQGTEE
eukprot:gene1419-2182_t